MNDITVHLAEGFEEIEAVTIIDILRRAGLDVATVSVSGNRLVKGAHHIEMKADLLFEEVDYTKCRMIILPGGMPGSKNLNEHKGLKTRILEFATKEKYLAAICAAPIVFGGLGILKGRKAVCFPGFEAQLQGADVQMSSFVTDNNIITGRGAGVAIPFSLEIVRILKGEEQSKQLASSLLAE